MRGTFTAQKERLPLKDMETGYNQQTAVSVIEGASAMPIVHSVDILFCTHVDVRKISCTNECPPEKKTRNDSKLK